jgi:hypothetical protein
MAPCARRVVQQQGMLAGSVVVLVAHRPALPRGDHRDAQQPDTILLASVDACGERPGPSAVVQDAIAACGPALARREHRHAHHRDIKRRISWSARPRMAVVVQDERAELATRLWRGLLWIRAIDLLADHAEGPAVGGRGHCDRGEILDELRRLSRLSRRHRTSRGRDPPRLTACERRLREERDQRHQQHDSAQGPEPARAGHTRLADGPRDGGGRNHRWSCVGLHEVVVHDSFCQRTCGGRILRDTSPQM